MSDTLREPVRCGICGETYSGCVDSAECAQWWNARLYPDYESGVDY